MSGHPGGRLVERLRRVAESDPRLAIGLSSGTSSDGIDAALVRLSGSEEAPAVEVLDFACPALAASLRERIRGARTSSAEDLARLSADLGEAFAGAALALIEANGLRPDDVSFIGSHGQTVYHDQPTAGRPGVTLQIGEPDIIAARTGVLTVADFRTADVAAGGSGAPLIPFVDWLLFRPDSGARLMVNIGGIANVSYVPWEREGVAGFDTGPGNALLDEIVLAATDGRETHDRDGARGLSGRPSADAVERFLDHPYFRAVPPKSTGKETFGRAAAERLRELVFPGRSPADLDDGELADLLATAARVTAESIRRGADLLPADPPVVDVVVSGGGVRNGAIMTGLSELFGPAPVVTLASLGWDPDAKEAVGFAVLANETLAGRPGNVPAATGASRPVVLGKICTGL